MVPTVRYATTGDDAHVAFALMGEGSPVVCMPPLPFSHIEAGQRLDGQRRWYELLAASAEVVVYDSRGTGLSDRGRTEFSLEAMLHDLTSVVDQLALPSFALCAFFNAAPVAIRFAVQHPERVTELVLWGGFARGRDVYELPMADASSSLVTAYWELLIDAAARMWTAASSAAAADTAAFFREAAEPAAAFAAFAAAREYDVTSDLAKVRARTLVVHRRDAKTQRLDIAQALASAIPNADLALLPGEAASPFSGDVAGGVRAIQEFLGLPTAEPSLDQSAIGDPQLTAREKEVLKHLCRGRSNKEIARELDVSIHTIERHLTNLYGKIGLHSRTEAVAYGLQRGYR